LRAQVDQESFGEILQNALDEECARVQVVEIAEDQKPARMVYHPHHPDADPNGYVAMPNVNPVEEMANMN